jgi:heptosyltransferase-1
LNSILVIRLKAIGDVLFTLPAVETLHRSHPNARIDFLTGTAAQCLPGLFPGVRDVFTLDRSSVGWGRSLSTLRTLHQLLRRLRNNRYDLVVDLHGLWETAWISRLTRASQRWGWQVGRPRHLPYTHCEYALRRPGVVFSATPDGEREWHPADWHLEILRRRGIAIPTDFPPLELPAQAHAEADRFLNTHAIRADIPSLFIQPFSSTARKDWPLERYRQLALNWRARNWQVLFGGSPAERSRLQPLITEGFPVAAGLGLLPMASLMQHSTLCVGSDSGPLHIGHAAGARIFLLRQFKNAYPWREPHHALTASDLGPVSNISLQTLENALENVTASLHPTPA